jgi:hypothetical protein
VVSFGLIEEWHPAPGRLVSWGVTAASAARGAQARPHSTPPSHQQQEYLRAAYRNRDAGFRFSRLCVVTFDIPMALDRDAMTRAVNAFVRRHDTFASWFRLEPDGEVIRHVVDADDIELAAVDNGEFTDPVAIREHIQRTTPDLFSWNCFSFGAIEHENSFTVYAAVDHLHTDGVAQAITGIDLITLYGCELSGSASPLAPAGSHVEYCERERRHTGSLTAGSPPVRAWIELVRRNGGDLPAFPLPLGVADEGYTRSAHVTVPLLTEAEALDFERACAERGGRFSGGIFAATALVERELAGKDFYFGLTPINTRATPDEARAVGWFSSLVPVAFDVPPDADFGALVERAQQAQEQGKELTDVSFHRVLELVTPDDGVRTAPGWSAPMMSYVDARKLTGADIFDDINGGLFGNRNSALEVLIWINRFLDRTTLSALFPDTPVARDSIDRYVALLREIFTTVARTGDWSALAQASRPV